MESKTPGTRIDVAIRLALWIDSNRSGFFERVLLMSLWRCTTAEIAANSGVPPWLNASASMASSGQIQSSGVIDSKRCEMAT